MIGKLPFEVLSLVLILDVGDRKESVRKGSPLIQNRLQETLDDLRQYRNFALSVAGVCKVWRALAISESMLWRLITLDFSKLKPNMRELQMLKN